MKSIAPGQNLFCDPSGPITRALPGGLTWASQCIAVSEGRCSKELPVGKGEQAVKLKIHRKISNKAREAISWLLPTVLQHGTRSYQTPHTELYGWLLLALSRSLVPKDSPQQTIETYTFNEKECRALQITLPNNLKRS